MSAKWKLQADKLSGAVLESLDEESGCEDLARRAHWSRTHFHRLFRAFVEETPAAMRRRLLLERAAWQLGRTKIAITDIAFDANYGSLEAFTRAFRRAFGLSPSLYRRLGTTYFRLPASNGIHFGAPGSRQKGTSDMDLFDRFAGSDSWHTKRLLEGVAKLTDKQLDEPLKESHNALPWEKPEGSLRDLLERLVFTKEIWTAALTGRDMPVDDPASMAERSPARLLARFEKADAEFNSVLRRVRDSGGWDDVFVDALCEPPETFTYGGMFAHVITFNTYKRLIAMAALRRMGAGIDGMGCPTEYEREVAPWVSDVETVKRC